MKCGGHEVRCGGDKVKCGINNLYSLRIHNICPGHFERVLQFCYHFYPCSCCVIVKNIERCLYLLPRDKVCSLQC